MSFLDHPDVFIGSTADGATFVVINARIPAADRLLTEAGFAAREHRGRTLYVLPPGTTNEDAHNRTGTALYGLLAHTMDFVDLSWTTRWLESGPLPEPDVHIQFSGNSVTATALTDAPRAVLEQHGFTADSSHYVLPDHMSEEQKVGAVVRAETHLSVQGIGTRVSLGIPTIDAIPPAPGRTSAPARPLSAGTPANRRAR